LVLAALAAVTYAVIEGSHRGYGSILIIGLLALAAVATTVLAGYEHRRHRPPIDPAFAGAALAAVAAFVALSGFLFLNTLYLQDVRGFSVLHAGLLTVPMAAAAAIVSPISGRLTAAHGPRMPLIAGGVVLSAAAALLTGVVPSTGLPALLTAYALFGAGFGLVNAPITATAVSGTPHVKADVSGAICSTARQIGSCLGVALLGSIVTARGSAHGGYTAASHVGWWLLAGCGAVIAVLAITTARGHATSAESTDPPARSEHSDQCRGIDDQVPVVRQNAVMPSPPTAPGTVCDPIEVSEPLLLTRNSSSTPPTPVWA